MSEKKQNNDAFVSWEKAKIGRQEIWKTTNLSLAKR